MSDCIRRAHSVWSRCTCDDCRADHRRMAKLARCGSYRRVTAEQAWEALDRLTDAGWTPAAIASVTGFSKYAIRDAMPRNGKRSRPGATLCAALVSVTGTPTAGYVSALGSRRRLQALSAIGWGLYDLADRMGIPFTTVAAIRRGDTQRVRPHTAGIIADAYEALSMTPGGSTQAVRQAREKGYPGPLCWDDDTIDDPDAHPQGLPTAKGTPAGRLDEVVVERLLAGERVKSSRAEKEEAMRRWLAAGRPEAVLCETQGWKGGRYSKRQGVAA